MRLAVDSWAFIESFFSGPRRAEVDALLKNSEILVTSREIVVETFNSIVYELRRTSPANDWLQLLRSSRTRVIEPAMHDVEAFMQALGARSTLSYADSSLAFVAQSEGIAHVITEDSGFRQARLEPLFSKPLRR